MTAPTLLIGLLWHACLTTTSANAPVPCPVAQSPMALPGSRSLGAFTPSGEQRYAPEDFPLAIYYVGEPPQRLDQGDINRAINGAITAWNNVPCSMASLRYEGNVDSTAEVPDGALLITHLEEEQAPCLKAGEVSRIGAAPCVIGERNFRAAVFNRSQMRWYMLDEVVDVGRWIEPELPWIDFRAALTHELGHMLGLNHPSFDEHTPRATMFASYRVDGGQSRLAATDRAHLCALYPSQEVGPQTCITADGCVNALEDPGAQCVELDAWRVCDKERGAPGDYCANNLLVCDDLCLITSPSTRTGFCTTRCTSNDECGQDWRCDLEGLIDPDPERRGVCKPDTDAPGTGCHQAPAPQPENKPWFVWCGVVGALAWWRFRRS